MVDFIGPGQVGIYDDAAVANQYARASDEAADARWVAGERRARYNEANRLNRTISAQDAAAYQRQAGLFSDRSDELANLGRRNRTPIDLPGAPAPASGANQQAAPTPASTPQPAPQATPPAVDINADRESLVEARQYTREELRRDPALARRIQDAANRGEIVLGNLVGGNLMVYPRTGSPPNTPHLGPVYFPRGNSSDVGGGYGLGIDPRFTAGAFGFRRIDQGVTDVTQSDAEYEAMVSSGSTPSGNPNAVGLTEDVDEIGTPSGATRTTGTSGTAPATGAAGVTPPGEDPIYEQWNDTSRSMEASPEMRLLYSTVENGIRRAQTYAQHGRPDLAEEAFAGAVTAQLQHWQMGNMAMLRAAASGSLSAAEALIARANSYPRAAVELTPVRGTNRMALRIQDDNGAWAEASSMTRPQLFNSLRSYADAAGSAADAERQQAVQIARMNNERYLAVANIEQQTAVMRIMHETGRAELAERVRLQIARGEADIHINSETGGAYVTYMDEHGDPAIDYVDLQEVPSPGTNGDQTVEMPVRRRVTGVNGVGAN